MVWEASSTLRRPLEADPGPPVRTKEGRRCNGVGGSSGPEADATSYRSRSRLLGVGIAGAYETSGFGISGVGSGADSGGSTEAVAGSAPSFMWALKGRANARLQRYRW